MLSEPISVTLLVIEALDTLGVPYLSRTGASLGYPPSAGLSSLPTSLTSPHVHL